MTCSLVTSSPPIHRRVAETQNFVEQILGEAHLSCHLWMGWKKILSSKFLTNMLVTPVEPKTAVVDDIGCWKGVEELLAGSVDICHEATVALGVVVLSIRE